LSSNAVVSIIAVIIIGAGLDKTGVMNKVAAPIIKLGGRSERRIMALIATTVGLISSMMQNIGAAALFLPAAQRIAKRLDIPVSRLLMPMGFCAIIGGTLTLVGASPTILLNDLLVLGGKKLEPFGLFTQTPIGVCLLSSAVLYFLLFGKFVLPASKGEADKGITAMLVQEYRALDQPYELHIPVTVVAIGNAKTGKKKLIASKADSISPGDDIVIMGALERIKRLAQDKGWTLKPGLDFFADEFARTNAGLVETVVSPRSELIGKTLGQVKFQERFGVNPVAVNKGPRIYYAGINHVKLKMGDTILLQGPWDRFHRIKNLPQPRIVTFASPLEGEILKPEKAKWAVLWLVVALAQIIIFDVRLSVALMSGALGMIITGVLSVDEAYHSVDWMTVFLLGGLIPLGIAFEQTGTAAFIAKKVLDIVGQVSPIGLLAVVGVMTSFFTLVISNVGATVLLVPLCMNMALSASNTFVLPTHQVNALIMRPGGYRTTDYAKAGAFMTIIFLAVMLTVIYFFYGVK